MWGYWRLQVRFDVFDIRLFRADDLVRFESVVSDVSGDGGGIPMTTAVLSWGGWRSEWLNFVSQGAGPVAPPIRTHLLTGGFFPGRGNMVHLNCVHSAGIS